MGENGSGGVAQDGTMERRGDKGEVLSLGGRDAEQTAGGGLVGRDDVVTSAESHVVERAYVEASLLLKRKTCLECRVPQSCV